MATVNELKQLLIEEVSGVDAPANELPGWILMKSAVEDSEMAELALKMLLEDSDMLLIDASQEVQEGARKLREHLEGKIEDVEKGVVPFQDHPIGPADRAWDSSAAIQRVRNFLEIENLESASDQRAYRQAFFWFDSEAPENFGSYKLPFVDIVDGRMVAIPRGLAAVAQRLDQTDIPASDKDAIRRQLDRYRRKRERMEGQAKKSTMDRIKELMSRGGDEEIMASKEELAEIVSAGNQELLKGLAELLKPEAAEAPEDEASASGDAETEPTEKAETPEAPEAPEDKGEAPAEPTEDPRIAEFQKRLDAFEKAYQEDIDAVKTGLMAILDWRERAEKRAVTSTAIAGQEGDEEPEVKKGAQPVLESLVAGRVSKGKLT